MNSPETPLVDITNTKLGSLPVMEDAAFLRPQGRIMDLASGEFALARADSVNWDSYGSPGKRYFTLDTFNDYQCDGITPSLLSYMPIVMKACMEDDKGTPREEYIADLRYIEDTTNLNRRMEIDPDDPEPSSHFRYYQRTRGAVLLSTLILPDIDGSTVYSKDPLFSDPAIELAEKVDTIIERFHATGRPQPTNCITPRRREIRLNGLE